MVYNGSSYVPYWYLTDPQGTIRDVIDNNATVRDKVTYGAFGNITAESTYDASGNRETPTNPAAYRGRYGWDSYETDAETGLNYVHARYYDPLTGRWMSQDPLGFDAGDSNLYRYVNNRPTVETDPSGLQELGDILNGIGKVKKGNDALIDELLGPNSSKKFSNGSMFDPSLAATKEKLGKDAYIYLDKTVERVEKGLLALDVTAKVGAVVVVAPVAVPAIGAPSAGVVLAGVLGTLWSIDQGATAGLEVMQGKQRPSFGGQLINEAIPNRTAATVLTIAYDNGPPLGVAGYQVIRSYKGQSGGFSDRSRGLFEFGQTEAPAPASMSATHRTFTTGSEWYEFFSQTYGAGNVEWTSGSGRTMAWPTELPLPTNTQMFRVRPAARSRAFVSDSDLETVAGPRPLEGIAHHNQPLGLNGVDNGVLNGSWQFELHQPGHDKINIFVNQLPYGTEIRIIPGARQ
jgi:RHS repeat-associated protein